MSRGQASSLRASLPPSPANLGITPGRGSPKRPPLPPLEMFKGPAGPLIRCVKLLGARAYLTPLLFRKAP